MFLLAGEKRSDDVLYEEIFNSLPKEKQEEFVGRKAEFAEKAGINP